MTTQPDQPDPAPSEVPSPSPSPSMSPSMSEVPPGATPVRVRRAPRYRAFVATGAVVGVLLGALVAFVVQPPDGVEEFSRGTVVRYLVVVLGLVGAIVGAGAAVLAERRR